MRILCSLNKYADENSRDEKILQVYKMFKAFIRLCKDSYGEDFIVYNVHNLIHLPYDCLKFGEVDNFSCFSFENFLFKMKGCIKSGNKPLAQFINRSLELMYINSIAIFNTTRIKINNSTNISKLVFSKFSSQMDDRLIYQQCQFGEIMIRSDRIGDSFCLCNDNIFIQVEEFSKFVNEDDRFFVKGIFYFLFFNYMATLYGKLAIMSWKITNLECCSIIRSLRKYE